MPGGERDGGGWLADQLAKPHRLAAFVLVAALLSIGALVGVASTIGLEKTGRQLLHPHWIWLPVALACQLVAYLGHTLAYREVAATGTGSDGEDGAGTSTTTCRRSPCSSGCSGAHGTRSSRSSASASTGDIACLWAALHVFYAQTPVAQLLVGYASGYALTRRTLPLGGAGVVESLLPFSLGWIGIARVPALLGVAAYRLFNLWLPLLPALAGLPSLRRLRPVRRRRTVARGRA